MIPGTRHRSLGGSSWSHKSRFTSRCVSHWRRHQLLHDDVVVGVHAVVSGDLHGLANDILG